MQNDFLACTWFCQNNIWFCTCIFSYTFKKFSVSCAVYIIIFVVYWYRDSKQSKHQRRTTAVNHLKMRHCLVVWRLVFLCRFITETVSAPYEILLVHHTRCHTSHLLVVWHQAQYQGMAYDLCCKSINLSELTKELVYFPFCKKWQVLTLEQFP